jgi:hypothetical protein
MPSPPQARQRDREAAARRVEESAPDRQAKMDAKRAEVVARTASAKQEVSTQEQEVSTQEQEVSTQEQEVSTQEQEVSTQEHGDQEQSERVVSGAHLAAEAAQLRERGNAAMGRGDLPAARSYYAEALALGDAVPAEERAKTLGNRSALHMAADEPHAAYADAVAAAALLPSVGKAHYRVVGPRLDLDPSTLRLTCPITQLPISLAMLADLARHAC